MSDNNFEQNRSEELLKVENLDKNEYFVTASVIEPPIEKVEKRPRTVTFFGALISAISFNKNDDLYATIRPTKTIVSLVMILILTICFYFFYQVADIKLMLSLIVFFASMAMPLVLITLNYELCPKKTFSFYHIILSFLFGVVLYLVINAIANVFLIKLIYKSTVNSIIVPIMWGLGEVLFIAILARVYEITDLSVGILLAVAVGMGYSTTLALQGLIGSLFIPVEVIIESNGSQHYVGSAIVDNKLFTQKSIKSAFDELTYLSFYFPFVICSWSVVIGQVVISAKTTGKNEGSFSNYLLVVLVISLYMLTSFSTSFNYFDFILKTVCLFASLYIAIRVVNKVLNKALLLDANE